jgi:hypothetical protein
MQESLTTNYKKASRLYYHCGHYINQDQQLKFLDCLEHSGNYPALAILDPKLRRQPPKPTEPQLTNKPMPSTETIRKFVYHIEFAKVLYSKTNVEESWTVLRDVLEVDPETWAEIDGAYPKERSLLGTIESLLQLWSLSNAVRGATVGVLYDKFKEHGHEAVGRKLY